MVEAIEAFTLTTGFGQFHGDPASERNKVCKVPAEKLDELIRMRKVKPYTDKPQLDHDHNGKAGGSVAKKEPSELGAARAAYREAFGKNAGPRLSAEQIWAKIAEAQTGQAGDQAPNEGGDDAPPTSD